MPEPTPFATPMWRRVVLSVCGGLLVWLSFPDRNLHVAAIVGMALLGVALWGVSVRAGAD